MSELSDDKSTGAAPMEWLILNEYNVWAGDCFVATGVHSIPRGSSVRLVEHSAYLVLEAKLNHCAVTGAAVAKERDEWKSEHDNLAAQLAEITSYMPKVPTEPYEKRLAQRIVELERECARKLQGPAQSGPERIAYLERELARERVKLMQDPRVRE